jgi:hypothetical protein
MEYVSILGRKVLSRPAENDGLIRYWLSRQGWRGPTNVKNGIIWVNDTVTASYLLDLLGSWDEDIPCPTVEVWGDDWSTNTTTGINV